MQRLANREAVRLGVDMPLRIVFSGTITHRDKPCRVRGRVLAHAHVSGPAKGTICVARGLKDWRDTIKHEVAHFARGGGNHGLGFLKARAIQGDPSSKLHLIRIGKARCGKHDWERGRQISVESTRRGMVYTYSAKCWKCGKEIP